MFGKSHLIKNITEKCEKEIEVSYTKKLTLADVMEWHQRRAIHLESSVLRYSDAPIFAPAECFELWQSSLKNGNQVVRSRIIYALSVEEELVGLLREGKGVYQILNH